MDQFHLEAGDLDFYESAVRKGKPLLVPDAEKRRRSQPEGLMQDRSWLGVPLYSKDSVIGALALGRSQESFNADDNPLAITFAMQAAAALANARLYDEVTGVNQIMERMVAERVEELHPACNRLAQHNKKNLRSFQQPPMNSTRP